MITTHLVLSIKMHRGVLIAILIVIAAATIVAQDQKSQDKSSASPISGRVLSRDGASMSNARVAITRWGVPGSTQTVRTDSSGAFASEPLEPGLYGLAVNKPGYVTELPIAGTTPTPTYYRPGDNATITLTKGGVITGTVKNSNGDPLIAVPVRVLLVRNREGKKIQFPVVFRERLTDDLGFYRLFGLSPGTYVVSAGGQSRFTGANPPTPYETETATYAPSSGREAAVEVAINAGDEAMVDIQYRSEPGHTVSGMVTGTLKDTGPLSFGASISLLDLRTRADLGGTANSSNNFGFSIYGVPDGEYELYATQGSPSGETLFSAPMQIKVQGHDVTGLTLAVAPLGAIGGRVILESDPKASCGKRRSSALAETMIMVRRHESADQATGKNISNAVPLRFINSAGQSFLDTKGAFEIRNLQSGTFRIDPREPASGWFVRSIAFDRPIRNLNIPRDGVTLKPGEKVSGLLVTVAEGAARLQGRLSLGEGQTLSAALRVYLTPSEREATDHVLRFYEARPEANGAFTVDNIAPGKYWIVAQLSEENDSGLIKSIRQDKAFRSNVLREAEALKKDLALKPCEQLGNYDLPLAPPSSP